MRKCFGPRSLRTKRFHCKSHRFVGCSAFGHSFGPKSLTNQLIWHRFLAKGLVNGPKAQPFGHIAQHLPRYWPHMPHLALICPQRSRRCHTYGSETSRFVTKLPKIPTKSPDLAHIWPKTGHFGLYLA